MGALGLKPFQRPPLSKGADLALSANPSCIKRWQTLGGIFSLIVETRLQGLGKVLNYGCFCMKVV